MQQDTGERGGCGEVKQNHQDRRLMKPMQGEDQQPQQPQKCPRCESINTKFCYYNNYSLSQPRYFCKTCRRYWTLGGTLRNVPVGGGCRKGKRTKTSSSSSSSGENPMPQISQRQPPPPPPQQNLVAQQNFISGTANSGNGTGLIRTGKESGDLVSLSSMGSYYSGGGFLNSLAAVQSFNNQPSHSFAHHHQPLNLGSDLGGSGCSNLGLLHGFNAVVPSFGSQQHQQIQHQTQFYHMVDRDNKTVELPFYRHEDSSLINQPSSRPTSSSHEQQNWQRGFISNNNPSVSDTALWSINTSTTAAGNSNTNNTAAGSSSLSPDHWHELQGYGSPP